MEIKDMPEGLNGLERFRYILASTLAVNENPLMQEAVEELYQTKEAFVHHFEYSIKVVAPELVGLILDGNADGSMKVAYPSEFAQILVIMLNMWLLPQGIDVDDGFIQRVDFIQDMCKKLGADVFDQKVKDILIGLYEGQKLRKKK